MTQKRPLSASASSGGKTDEFADVAGRRSQAQVSACSDRVPPTGAQDAVSLVMPARAECVNQAVSIVASTFGIAVVQASDGGDALGVKAVYRQVLRDVLRSFETIGEMLRFGSSARSKHKPSKTQDCRSVLVR